jgi:hypothetical protein
MRGRELKYFAHHWQAVVARSDQTVIPYHFWKIFFLAKSWDESSGLSHTCDIYQVAAENVILQYIAAPIALTLKENCRKASSQSTENFNSESEFSYRQLSTQFNHTSRQDYFKGIMKVDEAVRHWPLFLSSPSQLTSIALQTLSCANFLRQVYC